MKRMFSLCWDCNQKNRCQKIPKTGDFVLLCKGYSPIKGIDFAMKRYMENTYKRREG